MTSVGWKTWLKSTSKNAKLLYGLIDGSNDFYRPWGEAAFRSDMNVAFNLPTKELEALFLNEATAAGFSGLGGHRAIGGVRASIYNALTLGAVEKPDRFYGRFPL